MPSRSLSLLLPAVALLSGCGGPKVQEDVPLATKEEQLRRIEGNSKLSEEQKASQRASLDLVDQAREMSKKMEANGGK